MDLRDCQNGGIRERLLERSQPNGRHSRHRWRSCQRWRRRSHTSEQERKVYAVAHDEKKRQEKLEKEKAARQEDWGPEDPECRCSTCAQHVGAVEKDWLPAERRRLRWRTKNSHGRECGNECQECWHVRRKYYPGKAQTWIDDQKKESTAFADNINLERYNTVRGTNKYKPSRVGETEKKMSDKRGDFDEGYDTGYFYKMRDYVRMTDPAAHKRYKTDKELFMYMKDQGIKIVKDEEGNLGVEESNLPQGAIIIDSIALVLIVIIIIITIIIIMFIDSIITVIITITIDIIITVIVTMPLSSSCHCYYHHHYHYH